MLRRRLYFLSIFCGLLAVTLSAVTAPASEVTAQDLSELTAQNRRLQDLIQRQQQQIDELRQRLDDVQNRKPEKTPEPKPEPNPRENSFQIEPPVLRTAREIRLSGEVGLAFFKSERDGQYPNSEFVVDEARLYLEAPIWQTVYFFTELQLATRESAENSLYLGELYADVENLFTAGPNAGLNLRVGRFNIPFGEEYQSRNVMANPLITHSIADIWGIDEGVQIYGLLGNFQYNLAVQNGGSDTRHDYNSDKSVTARLGLNPLKSLHLSASAHRTGKLDTKKDLSSEIWFGGEYLGPIGSATSTPIFQANLYEIDAQWQWSAGHIKATVGSMEVQDNRPTGDVTRRGKFYSIEALQQISPKLYAATRFGEIHIPDGYPLVGLGNYGKFYYASPPTENLSRLSFGLGYRFSEPLIWKVEYSWEHGQFITGETRDHEDMFSTELGLKF